MKNKNATARNLALDIALTAGFALSLKPFVTGIAVHEWLGLAVGGGLVIHGLLHRKWIAAITGRLSGKLPLRTRACYGLDALLMIAFGAILTSGVLMSEAVLPALGLTGMPSLLLVSVHNIAAWSALGALALKLALHAEWIVAAVRVHILRREPHQGRTACEGHGRPCRGRHGVQPPPVPERLRSRTRLGTDAHALAPLGASGGPGAGPGNACGRRGDDGRRHAGRDKGCCCGH